jgi:beta-galactosidase
VSFRSTKAYKWADSQTELAWFQYCLHSNVALLPAITANYGALAIHCTNTTQTISGRTFELTFSRVTGNLTSWIANGRSILTPDPATGTALSVGCWRPPTSNDMPFDLGEWRRFGVDTLTYQLRDLKTEQVADGSVQVVSRGFIGAPILSWGFVATSTFTISGDETVFVSIHLEPKGPAPKTLPRLGLDLYVADELDNASWFGRGPGESYADKKRSQKMGIYQANTAQLHTPYEVPQENGNRSDTRWLKLADGRGWGLHVTRGAATVQDSRDAPYSPVPFDWAASRYSAAAIEQAKHPNDLILESAVRLRLDVANSGVGTGACGPRTLEKYEVPCKETLIAFRLNTFFGDACL